MVERNGRQRIQCADQYARTAPKPLTADEMVDLTTNGNNVQNLRSHNISRTTLSHTTTITKYIRKVIETTI